MKKLGIVLIGFLIMVSCSSDDSPNEIPKPPVLSEWVSGVDVSIYPRLYKAQTVVYNKAGVSQDMLDILKTNGVNTLRFRLWVNPDPLESYIDEVRDFAYIAKSKGFKIWISLHYSDTWADPGKQDIPITWQHLNYESLKQAVYNHTKEVMVLIDPEYIQIGNEINNGLLFPLGNRYDQPEQFKGLIAEGIKAVRDANPDTKIILHHAGYQNALTFYQELQHLDYDVMGISYYPIWHGKSLPQLKQELNQLTNQFGKQVLIAETAYPFTLDWYDQTNNIIGNASQILSQFPATSQGQKDYVNAIEDLINQVNQGMGFCYWAGDWIAFKGADATDGSPWENQALFDFDHKALPALEAFDLPK